MRRHEPQHFFYSLCYQSIPIHCLQYRISQMHLQKKIQREPCVYSTTRYHTNHSQLGFYQFRYPMGTLSQCLHAPHIPTQPQQVNDTFALLYQKTIKRKQQHHFFVKHTAGNSLVCSNPGARQFKLSSQTGSPLGNMRNLCLFQLRFYIAFRLQTRQRGSSLLMGPPQVGVYQLPLLLGNLLVLFARAL